MNGVVTGLTVGEVLARGASRVAAAGCETPRLDAEVLLAHVLGVDRARLVIAAHEPVDAGTVAWFDQLLTRRSAREPVAYIIGTKEFRRISLAVDRRVLIPRPETELLVEVGLGLPRGASVIDVGTGSGAVALALKDERPDLAVTAADPDPGALAVAARNAARLGLDVEFRQADLLEGLPDRYDAVLANLPYVPESAADALPPEISRYEPRAALFAGGDGLALIRRLVPMARDARLLALEVGWDQAEAVAALMRGAEFGSVERLRDLAGHERVVVGRR